MEIILGLAAIAAFFAFPIILSAAQRRRRRQAEREKQHGPHSGQTTDHDEAELLRIGAAGADGLRGLGR